MKKIIVLITIILGSFGIKAQTAAPTFTVTPSDIDALTENVTIVFDVTGSAVEGVTDIYIWAWGEGLTPSEMLLCYESGIPAWGSISKNAILDPVAGEPNKRMLKLPKTVTRAGVEVTFNNMAELFGVGDTPGKLKKFGFLLRSQDGNKETPGNMVTAVTLLPLEFEKSYFRTFPAKVSNNDVVTAYLNLALIESGENQKLKIADQITATISLLTANDTKITSTESLTTTYTNEKEYAISFLPEMLTAFPEGISIDDVAKCQILFSGNVYLQDGTSEVVKTKTFEFDFQLFN